MVTYEDLFQFVLVLVAVVNLVLKIMERILQSRILRLRRVALATSTSSPQCDTFLLS